MRKNMLLIILIAVLLFSACVSEDSNTNNVLHGTRKSLDESYLNRTIDYELGVACYSLRLSQVSVLFDCVKVNKDDLP